MIYGRGVGSVTTLKTFQTWKTDGSSDVDTFIKNQIFGSEFYYSNGFIRADGPLGMTLFLLLSICFIFFLWEAKLFVKKITKHKFHNLIFYISLDIHSHQVLLSPSKCF